MRNLYEAFPRASALVLAAVPQAARRNVPPLTALPQAQSPCGYGNNVGDAMPARAPYRRYAWRFCRRSQRLVPKPKDCTMPAVKDQGTSANADGKYANAMRYPYTRAV